MKVELTVAGAILSIGILFTAGNPIFFVQPGEEVVIKKLGKLQTGSYEEGMHLKAPFVSSVHKVDLQIQKMEITEVGFSKDLQDITVQAVVNFRAKQGSGENIIRNTKSLDNLVNTLLIPTVKEAVKASTSKRTATNVAKERVALRNEIQNFVKEAIEPYGIEIPQISISNLEFSDEFKKAIESKQIAEQTALKAKFLAAEAEQKALAEVNLAKGKAEAQRLLREAVNKEGGDKLVELKAIEKWDGTLPQYVMGDEAVPFIDINK